MTRLIGSLGIVVAAISIYTGTAPILGVAIYLAAASVLSPGWMSSGGDR